MWAEHGNKYQRQGLDAIGGAQGSCQAGGAQPACDVGAKQEWAEHRNKSQRQGWAEHGNKEMKVARPRPILELYRCAQGSR